MGMCNQTSMKPRCPLIAWFLSMSGVPFKFIIYKCDFSPRHISMLLSGQTSEFISYLAFSLTLR